VSPYKNVYSNLNHSRRPERPGRDDDVPGAPGGRIDGRIYVDDLNARNLDVVGTVLMAGLKEFEGQ
jgi:hypothetical protein